MVARGTLREEAISRLFVNTSRVEHAFERLDDLMERGWETTYCRALVIYGPSRCGKTTLVREWIARRQAKNPDFKATVSEVPSDPKNLKSMAAQVLQDLGDPDFDRGSEAELTRRIRLIAEEHDVLVIDEINRLVDENSGRTKKGIASWLTNILNRRVCPLVLVGEPHAEFIFQGNMYLAGRTLGSLTVAPYDWNDEDDRKQFRILLALMDKNLGFPQLSGLSEEKLALSIHAFSEGRIGQVTLLLDAARHEARKRGHDHLSWDVLAKAADDLQVLVREKKPNPFRIGNARSSDIRKGSR